MVWLASFTCFFRFELAMVLRLLCNYQFDMFVMFITLNVWKTLCISLFE